MELNENINAIESYLKSRPEVLKLCRSDSNRHTEKLNNEFKDEVTSGDISEWLDKSSGEVISHYPK